MKDHVTQTILRRITAIEGNSQHKPKLTTKDKELLYQLHNHYGFSFETIRLYFLKVKKITISRQSLYSSEKRIKKTTTKTRKENKSKTTESTKGTILFDENPKKQQKSHSSPPLKTSEKPTTNSDSKTTNLKTNKKEIHEVKTHPIEDIIDLEISPDSTLDDKQFIEKYRQISDRLMDKYAVEDLDENEISQLREAKEKYSNGLKGKR